jgi:fructoselysine 3-epimerase
MKISTATSVFVNYAIQDAVSQVIRAGFDGIDLWCGRPHLYRKDYTMEQIKELRNMLEDAGIPVVSLFPAFYRYPYSLSNPNHIIRQDSIDYVKNCIENAVLVGARQVLIVPTHSIYGQPTQDSRDRFLESLATLCPMAESAGILLGIEILYPNLSDYMYSSEQALTMIRQLGSDCLKVVLDTGHVNLSGEGFSHAMAALGKLVIQVHVNDNDGKQQQNAIPGTGTFEFYNLARQLQQEGYDDFLTLELGWNYSFDPYPAVSEGLKRMRSYLENA